MSPVDTGIKDVIRALVLHHMPGETILTVWILGLALSKSHRKFFPLQEIL
jgi:hypothetical protein